MLRNYKSDEPDEPVDPNDPAYLFTPEGTPIAGHYLRGRMFDGTLLSAEIQQNIINRLADKGVHTYGQFVEFCINDSLVDALQGIQGIEPRTIETMMKAALADETGNKYELVSKYERGQKEIARLKQEQTAKQLDKATIDGREIAKSM